MDFYEDIKDTGAGKISLLHKIFEENTGKKFPVWQQQIGDCVSFGYALAVSTLMGVQISENPTEKYPAHVATEPIYGGSRVEIGKGRLGCSIDNSDSADGSYGIWAAKWVQDYGILLRKNYKGFDLSSYNGQKARNWGCYGVPDVLEPIARKHPVKQVALVQSYEEARDALANGYPIPVCSSRGFEERRDTDGFARPYGTWYHCMCFIAVDDNNTRPGLLCCNSWGENWIFGPKRHDQPDGSFWVDADVADKMLSQGDSYALSNFDGFKKNDMQQLMKKLKMIP